MFLKNESNTSLFEEKITNDNKDNIQYINKYRSNQTLPSIFCNQFNKALITGINPISDISTINSISNSIKDKHIRIKKKMGINFVDKLNINNADEIVDNKKKPFKALEDLLMNDEVNDNIINESNITSNLKDDSMISITIYETQTANTSNLAKEKKCLSVPKLDFTTIHNKYKNTQVYIKEVKNKSKNKSRKKRKH